MCCRRIPKKPNKQTNPHTKKPQITGLVLPLVHFPTFGRSWETYRDLGLRLFDSSIYREFIDRTVIHVAGTDQCLSPNLILRYFNEYFISLNLIFFYLIFFLSFMATLMAGVTLSGYAAHQLGRIDSWLPRGRGREQDGLGTWG